MAYGKIKADTLVYDNSGSDVETSISSLAAKANSPASAGTVGASEVVQVDANKDITGFRNVTLSGDLTVNGTTTTIDSTTLTVEDKNIELGKVDTPTDTTADGGGITLKGATDKTITWSDTSDYWTFNQGIETTAGVAKITGIEGGETNLYMYADEGDDNADKWKLKVSSGASEFDIGNFATGSWVTNLRCYGNNAVDLYYQGSVKLATTSAGVTVTGTVTDSKGDVRSIPLNNQSSAYTLVAADAGKTVTSNGGTITVNGSVMSSGDAVTLINNSGSDMTITQGSGSMSIYNTADASTGNRTLASRGMATIYFFSATVGYISGAGLS